MKNQTHIDSINLLGSRRLPQSIDAEMAVLGAMMQDSRAIIKAVAIVNGESFYNEANRQIFNCIISMYERNMAIDIVSLAEELLKRNKLEQIGNALYLSQISDRIPTAANVEIHSRIVQERFIKRTLIQTAGQILSSAYDDGSDGLELLEESQKELSLIANSIIRSETVSPKEWTLKVNEHLENYKNKTNIKSIPTGYLELDNILQGGFSTNFHLIAGLPSQGKTSFAVQIVNNNRNKPMLFHTMDEPFIKVALRLLSNDTNIDAATYKGLHYPMSDDQRLKITKSLSCYYEENNIFINDKFMDIDTFFLYAQMMKHKYDIQFIISDYLQLYTARATKSTNEVANMTYISKRFKELSRVLDIPVICLSQLNREVHNTKSKIPYLNNLRQSGSLEQDADMIIFMYYPYKFGFDIYPDESRHKGAKTQNRSEIIVAKNKDGETSSVLLEYYPNLFKYKIINVESGYLDPPKHFQDDEKGLFYEENPF